MSEVKVNKLSPRSGTTVTLGDSGDTITIPSGVTFDASSGGLAGTLTTAAQPNITSVGTLTSFTSTGIDDNATSTAITIDSSQNVDVVGTTTSSNFISDGAGYGIKFPLNGTATLNTSSNSVIFTGSGSSGDYLAGTLNLQSRGNLDRDINLITGATASKTITAHGNGDVSFYEDTGTTAKLFWDSSSEHLDLTSAIADYGLKVENTVNNSRIDIIASNSGVLKNSIVNFGDSASSNVGNIDYDHNDNSMRFGVNGSEHMRIDSSGNLLVGTTSVQGGTAKSLQIADSSSARLLLQNTGGGRTYGFFTGTDGKFGLYDYTTSAQRLAIDTSGNVGIGTTSPQEKLDIDGNIAISGNTLFEEVVSTAGMPSSAGNKTVNTDYDSTFSLTAGKWLILVNASLQVFQTSSNESGLYQLSLSLGSSAGADNYGLIQKAVLKWGNGSNSYGDNSGGHFPILTLGSTTTLHTRWRVTEYGTGSNFWVRGNLTRIRCIRIG